MLALNPSVASGSGSQEGRRIRRLLSHFVAGLLLVAAGSTAVEAAAVPTPAGWTVHASAHFRVYVAPGGGASGRAEAALAELERIHAQVIAPLRVRPLTVLYPLFPNAERFRSDWWQFASQGYGDVVYAWGGIDRGGDVSPYQVTRAVVSRVFPRALPFLRWGFGDALADRAAGVDAHRHLRALAASGIEIPSLLSVLPPADFGNALPVSYPVAVSFMAYLLDTYGPERTAAFVAEVEFRYYDVEPLFEARFGAPLHIAEAGWRAEAARGPVVPLDVQTYLAVTQFVYRTTLAGSPSQVLLEPEGATVVDEAFRAILPLRRLEVAQAASHMETAFAAEERAARRSRLQTTTARGLIGLLIIAPILVAVGLLAWPSVRAKVAGRRLDAEGRRRKAEGSES